MQGEAVSLTKIKPFNRERARLDILNYITNFCLTRFYGKDSYGGIEGFITDEATVEVGDLVALTSAPTSKWHLSWLREIDLTTPEWPKYLLESIHDGSLCWWGNCGLYYLRRSARDSNSDWLWDDGQFTFNDRWNRVCYKEKDAYIVRPWLKFGEGFAVTLGGRTTHGMDKHRPSRDFPDYRKVTKAIMGETYDWLVAERDRLVDAEKAALTQETPDAR